MTAGVLQIVGRPVNTRQGFQNHLARRCVTIPRTATFRSRKQIEAAPEQDAAVETKFRCKECGHVFKERVPGLLPKRPAPPA
jgi:hypothetical protein